MDEALDASSSALPLDTGLDYSWYAFMTITGHEQKAARGILARAEHMALADQVVDVRVVVDELKELVQGKLVKRPRLRWPGLVLVRMAQTAEAFLLVRRTPSVIGSVGAGDFPTPLSEDEFASMTAPFGQGDDVTATDQPKPSNRPFEVGEVLNVVDGPFATLLLTVTAVEGDRISGLVSVFGRETPVTLASELLRRS